MKHVRHIIVLFLIIFFSSSTVVQAQTCYSLSQQRAALADRMARLVADYPGTHIVIGLCAAGARDTYQRTGSESEAQSAFAVCAVIGCGMAGFDNCMYVVTQWFSFAIQDEQLRRRLAGC